MGSILITQDGVETLDIEKSKRDKALRDFFEMLDAASLHGDSTYMLETAPNHRYSYGEYYPAFVNFSWDEFSNMPAFEGVSFSTYYAITNDHYVPYPTHISDRTELEQYAAPHGEGGFEHAHSPADFLCNISRWRNWHRDYLQEHPEQIDWSKNDFLPNQEAIFAIIEEEIDKYISSKYETPNKNSEIKKIRTKLFEDSRFRVDEKRDNPLKDNAPILFFHSVIVPFYRGKGMAGYCIEVGDKICRENYYTFEKALSSKEQQATGAMRHIWSIVKAGQKQYISFDFHKGMFEFHNHLGEHLGEYHFDGSFNASGKKDHNLKTSGRDT